LSCTRILHRPPKGGVRMVRSEAAVAGRFRRADTGSVR
jgi:hypothetical protein